ncbi:MAG: amidohydrolase family protein, partial [Candidatus Paceibacterota bacterium]
VTTVIGGNCGSSLAPISQGELDSVKKWGVGGLNKININWHEFKEFIEVIEKRGLGVNFGTLLGHHTVRSEVVKDESKDLSGKELDLLLSYIKEGLKDGALGVSIGLDHFHSKNVQIDEIKKVSELVDEEKRVISSHLIDSEDPNKSLKYLLKRTKENSNKQLNHLQPLASSVKEYKELEEVLTKKSTKESINFDCCPYPATIIPLYKFLPDWAQFGSLQEMVEVLEKNEEKIIDHFKGVTSKKMIFANIPSPLDFYNNKTLKEISENNKTTQIKALYKLLIQTKLRGVCIYHNVNEKVLDEFIFSDLSFISSNGLNIILPKFNAFTEFLDKVNTSNKISLEKAISKITSLPAKKFGIKNRGVIKENYKGDVVVLDNFKVRDVVINGKICFKNNQVNKTLSGNFIKWEN